MPADPDEPTAGHADPDSRARTHLANERTFLAWFRTGLGLVVVGIGAAQFIAEDRHLVTGLPIVSGFSAILIGAGIAMVGIGAGRFLAAARAIDAAAYRPTTRPIVLATVIAVVVGVLSIALVLLLRGR